METDVFSVKQIFIQIQINMVFHIVDNAERGNAARLQAKIFVHASLRCEAELSLLQAMFQIVNRQLLHAVENHQIMAVSLVIPEEEVLTVRPLELAPIIQRVLNSRQRRMKYQLKRNPQLIQLIDDLFLTFG